MIDWSQALCAPLQDAGNLASNEIVGILLARRDRHHARGRHGAVAVVRWARASRSDRVFTLPRYPMDWVFSESNLLFGSVR
jgi:hypothetical protein